jgi:hypothetical protein
MAQRTQRGDFYWFFGVVENRIDDPLQLGRVKVRILNYHSPFDSDIKTKELPWATVMLPTTEAGTSGVGSSNGLVDGSWVFGFFKDGKHAQQPVIIGTIPGFNKTIESPSKGQDPTQDDSQKEGSGKGSQGFGGKHLENHGDGFRDRRTEEELLKYPRRIKSIKLPEGCIKQGNDHGIQFEENKATKYPLEEYKDKVDTNIVALADKDRLKKTLYQYKKIPRSKGGLRDDGFWVYGMDMGDKFKCGVTNESGISRASHIKPVMSTSKNFLLKNYSPFKETPPALTDGGIRIYNPKNII